VHAIRAALPESRYEVKAVASHTKVLSLLNSRTKYLPDVVLLVSGGASWTFRCPTCAPSTPPTGDNHLPLTFGLAAGCGSTGYNICCRHSCVRATLVSTLVSATLVSAGYGTCCRHSCVCRLRHLLLPLLCLPLLYPRHSCVRTCCRCCCRSWCCCHWD